MPDSLPPIEPAGRLGLDYATLSRTPVATDPFPHVVVRNFVPAGPLDEVIAALPEIAGGGS